MKRSVFSSIKDSLLYAKEWFSDTPERALEQAYNAALQIKAIEDEYFDGQKINPVIGNYSDSVMAYFQIELRKNLTIAKNRLAEFRASKSILNLSNYNADRDKFTDNANKNGKSYIAESNQSSIILEKLNFIDRVISKYNYNSPPPQPERSVSLVVVPQNEKAALEDLILADDNEQGYRVGQTNNTIDETVSDKTGILPRSIFKTINRLQKELDPQSEEEVVKKFRKSKVKTATSIRFILILIIVPLLTYQVSKLFIVGPLVDKYKSEDTETIFFFFFLEEEALNELRSFKEKIEFESLVWEAPKLSAEQIEEKVREKALEIANRSRRDGAEAIKNIFSDLLSLIAFAFVIVTSRRQIAVLKSFMDDIVYGLSDSAKAFIIILFTDIFVGYHSPHGWEVLLATVSRHLGLPENQDFIFLFIATFPVILDTVFKYWIFRYLNRISPSAVATYRNMNE